MNIKQSDVEELEKDFQLWVAQVFKKLEDDVMAPLKDAVYAEYGKVEE